MHRTYLWQYLGIVPTPESNTLAFFVGRGIQGEPCSTKGGKVPLLSRQATSLALNVMEKELMGSGRERQRMANKLDQESFADRHE